MNRASVCSKQTKSCILSEQCTKSCGTEEPLKIDKSHENGTKYIVERDWCYKISGSWYRSWDYCPIGKIIKGTHHRVNLNFYICM